MPVRKKQATRKSGSKPQIAWSSCQRKLNRFKLESAAYDVSVFDLPKEYKAHMLRHNGGRPTPGYFLLKTRDRTLEMYWVCQFWHVNSSPIDSLNLTQANFRLCTRAQHMGVPRHCMSIGVAVRDDDILLFTEGPRRGEIWLKRWEEMPDDGYGEADYSRAGLYKLAPSLTAFFDSLMSKEEAAAAESRWNSKRR